MAIHLRSVITIRTDFQAARDSQDLTENPRDRHDSRDQGEKTRDDLIDVHASKNDVRPFALRLEEETAGAVPSENAECVTAGRKGRGP
jgi:hypothetical protein